MPLSPLLFILVLEILLQRITSLEEIKGTKIKHECYKHRAFTDDVMFILENPMESITKLFDEIKKFGKWTGFFVNKAKAKIMCKNMTNTRQKELNAITGCEIADKVRYLGVNLTTRNTDLFKNNYGTLWESIQIDLKKWNKLNHSVMGRIAVIKVNILPRIMFLFQTISII